MALGIGSHSSLWPTAGSRRRSASRSTGRELTLSNLDKLLYPAAGLPQGRRHRLLPPDRAGDAPPPRRAGRRRSCGRPTVPQGERFFEKRCPPHHPEWVRTSDPARGERRATQLHRRGAPDARVAREPRRARAAHEPVDARRRRRARRAIVIDLDPGRARDDPRLLPRRARAARHARRARICSRGREDVGRQGPAPLGAAQRRRRSTDDDTKQLRARARAAARVARDPKRVHGRTWRRPKRTGGVRRLEPERPAQDDDLRVLAAHRGTADRVDAGRRGTRCTTRSTAATRTRSRSRRRPCSNASPNGGDLYAESLTVHQELPAL